MPIKDLSWQPRQAPTRCYTRKWRYRDAYPTHFAVACAWAQLRPPWRKRSARRPANPAAAGDARTAAARWPRSQGRYGEPTKRHAAVGNPPITRWDYPQFSVYFENDRVLHRVAREDDARRLSVAAPGPQVSCPQDPAGFARNGVSCLAGCHDARTRLHEPSLPRGSETVRWGELYGSSPAYFLAEAAASRRARRSSSWPAAGARPTNTWPNCDSSPARICALWSFPDRETLPYDPFSPHPDIVSERLRTLAALPATLSRASSSRRRRPSSIACRRARSLRRMPSRWRAGERIDLPQLRKRLIDAGYVQVTQVLSPGEFAVRGSVDGPISGRCAPAVPARLVRRPDRVRARLRSHRTSAPASGWRPCRCCPRARFHRRPKRSRRSAAAGASASRVIRRQAACIARSRPVRCRRASSPGCRSSSATRSDSRNICRPTTSSSTSSDLENALRRLLGRRSSSATKSGDTIASGRCCRLPKPSFLPTRRSQRSRAIRALPSRR